MPRDMVLRCILVRDKIGAGLWEPVYLMGEHLD